MLRAKLVVVGGDAKSKEVDLRLPTVIGRGREVSLTLPHPLVSRRHTELFEKDGYLYVRDLGSLNGTYVNNRKIDGEQRLAPNELLTLGNVTFRALYDAVGEPAMDIGGVPEVSQSESDTQNSENQKNKTVPLNRIDQAYQGLEAKKPQARKPLKSVPTASANIPPKSNVKETNSGKVTLAKANANEAAPERRKPVNQRKPKSKEVETPSDIFSGDEEFLTPEKSISVSALESLPPLNPSVSVMGSALDFGDQPHHSAIESVDLEIEGQQADDDSGKSDAALGSFLKKLPR